MRITEYFFRLFPRRISIDGQTIKNRISRGILSCDFKNNHYRKIYLYGIKKYTKLSLREIGDLSGMDYAAVSQMIKRLILAGERSYELKMILEKFEREVQNA